MLEIKALCGGYGGKPVLQGISLQAPAGQVTAIIGPNGCGKSTLLKAVCGMLRDVRGEVLLDGEPLLALPRNQLAQRVTYMAQSRRLPDVTAGRLVLYGRYPYLQYPRRYGQADHAIAQRAMEQMQIQDLADTPMEQLSGGQQQKAYFAMALAQDTPVAVLDEPTTYLDVACQLQVLRQARMLAREGKHVLMVIHDLSHAMQTADQVVLMQDGKAVMQGTPEAVYAAGRMDEVFGVKVLRLRDGEDWHYFCAAR